MSPVVVPEARLPVCVITGFLGTGKTTLLKRVLRDPRFADSAVIVNEYGEVPLDHDLIAASEDTLISVSTGCLCCVVRSDLTETLLDLARRREAGEVPAYARVVIETSGLADPAPILHALMADERVATGHILHAVVTLVDAATGAAVLARHPEAQRQAMLADRLLLTKTDLAPAVAELEAALTALNPAAPRLAASHGEVDPAWLFAPGSLPEFLEANARHTEGVASIVLERETPLPALALTLWLQGLVEHCGPRLLRLKGLVALAEAPEKPVALHAVQHLLHPLEWLDSWPGTDRRSRIVLIGEGIPRHLPARLLAAIEAEVRDS
ncbi:CobW family GTP-binding protein [Siccirubricoccus phaeus]|uniref:CobW family GTP-binding protein n=1 Tax=Siccirubricoccus phaeus TaxID=2595053 RepID=UPI0011F1389B|nr:GTP-binding protein [Siccirubricoccus phaeus]